MKTVMISTITTAMVVVGLIVTSERWGYDPHQMERNISYFLK